MNANDCNLIQSNTNQSLSAANILGTYIISLSGHTEGSIGIDVDNKHLIVGDALMNMFFSTVSMLYHNRDNMLESARKAGRIKAGRVTDSEENRIID